MTEEQIIKALEYCNQEDKCHKCPYDLKCYDENYKSILAKDALDLINRKDSEIDMLIRKKEKLMDKIAELQAENEKLKADNEILSTQLHYIARELEEVKTATF